MRKMSEMHHVPPDMTVKPLKKIRVALAGNPNTGKTSIFNNITGARHKVANWAGVTVEKKEGSRLYKGARLELIDLPGTYSLTAYSMEEIIARNYVIEEKPDVVVQVIDATNLERNLYLFTQLLELKTPIVLALNMWDEALERGDKIDVEALSKCFGVPVVPTVGRLNQNTEALLDAVLAVARDHPNHHQVSVDYGLELNDEIRKVEQTVSEALGTENGAHWWAIKLLENDPEVMVAVENFSNAKEIKQQLESSQQRIAAYYKTDPEALFAERRYGFIKGACLETIKYTPARTLGLSERVDKLLTNRVLGFPIFIFFIWLLFQATFTLGQYPMDWIDAMVGTTSGMIDRLIGPGILNDLLVNGILNGVGSVIIFLPNILILYFGIALMEDTGYMARAAFLMDRVMQSLGLHGKSFIPLIMGFGCNVPAIMATRTLENRRDRILTTLINPLMSCNARLTVYILFAGTFFAETVAGNIVFSIYALGVLLAMGLGKLFSKTILTGESAPFVMELPPYRIPTMKSLFYHMWDRGVIYLKKMGGVILVASIIIWFLGAFPKAEYVSTEYEAQVSDLTISYQREIATVPANSTRAAALEENLAQELAAIEHEQAIAAQKNTYIGRIGTFIEPVMAPLGFDWRMSVSLVTGFVAKEVVVSTLGVLYQIGEDVTEHNTGLREALRQSGLTPLIAYAYMVFVLIYTPCLVTLIAIKRETGSWGWMWFSVVYELVLAWVLAFLVYRVGLFFSLG